jgi:hypothetical protein
MLPDHYKPRPPIVGGCFTCRYGGAPLSDFSNPLAHHTIACSKPNTWPATFPEQGCSGWQREPGSDDA